MRQEFRKCFLAIAVLTAIGAVARAEEGGFDGVYGNGPTKVVLATGSPGELGLVEALARAFLEKHDVTILWKKAGSGEALALLKAKQADVVMVHAPEAEKQAVEEGWGAKRTLLGSNEFYIVGPAADPAEVAGAKTAAEAFARIAKTRSRFLSRGDNSGTHKKELQIWKAADIAPEGDWYAVAKDFMLGALKRANDEKAYFLSDSSTWVAAKKDLPNLKVLFRGDPVLVNVYHALCQPQLAASEATLASQFIDFLSSEEGQGTIREFGKDSCGESLYNDSEYARTYDR